MSYDFTALAKQAQDAINNSNNANNTSFKYALVYPGQGDLSVRLLYNPASSLVSRLISRHNIQSGNSTIKVPCLRTYGQECPICKVLKDIKAATGQELTSFRSQTRAISFAQYVSSSYNINEGRSTPINPGDVILLMYPWTVYGDIQSYISEVASTPSGMTEAFTRASGYVTKITRGSDNKYTVTNSPFSKFESAKSDEEFLKIIEGVESLNEQVLSSAITEEMTAQINGVVNDLTTRYLVPQAPQVPTYGQPMNAGQVYAQQPPQYPQQTMNVGPNMTMPTQAQYPPNPQSAPVMQSPNVAPQSANPECFGKYDPSSDTCLICPNELSCQQASGK